MVAVAVWVEQPPLAFAAALDSMQGRLGRPQQFLRRLAAADLVYCDADAAGDGCPVAVEVYRLGQLRVDARSQRGDVRRRRRVHDEDREPVGAEPCHRRLLPDDDGLQPLGDPPQQPVPDVAAERVVDDGEAVQIDRVHGDPVAAAERAFQAGDEELLVGQAGEGVMQGLMAQAVSSRCSSVTSSTIVTWCVGAPSASCSRDTAR